jgi:hypothetical protein
VADYHVPTWVAIAVIVFTIGRTCIGFPDWLRERISHTKR